MKNCNFLLLPLVVTFLAGCQGGTTPQTIDEGPAPIHNLSERVKLSTEAATYAFAPYPDAPGALTPAPGGYSPFYISHYGRHGSRYHTSESFFRSGLAGLKAAAEAGILTDEGKDLAAQFEKVHSVHQGMLGQLSPRGAREHRAIGGRMADNFPEVFRGRHDVDVVISTMPRCLISMSNFTFALKDRIPSIQYSYTTGDKYFDLLCHSVEEPEFYAYASRGADSLRNALCTYDGLFGRIFTDQEKAREVISSPASFVESLYLVGSICPCLDFTETDILSFFPTDELTQQAIVRSDNFYIQYGGSQDLGRYSNAAAHDLLEDFLVKADDAMAKDSGKAADLRFGHDTGILPLMGLIGIEGMDKGLRGYSAHETWSCDEWIPMASNFQMVFYRGKDGDVIVKMLYNEKETRVPALPTWSGPYYKWEDLRAYLAKRLEGAVL